VSGSAAEDFNEGISNEVSDLGLVTPNPVFGTAVIPVNLATADLSCARLLVFDISGRTVADLSAAIGGSGLNNVLWDVSEVPSGVHFVRLETSSGVVTRRIVVAKR
jgi:hypothetical protein